MKSLRLADYFGTELSDRMLAFAISTVPQCGFSGFSTIINFVVRFVLANFGLAFTTDELVSSLPSHNKIKEMIIDKAVDTVLLTQNSIRKNQHAFILAEKGNKKGNKNLAKFICWYNIDDHEVKTILLNLD